MGLHSQIHHSQSQYMETPSSKELNILSLPPPPPTHPYSYKESESPTGIHADTVSPGYVMSIRLNPQRQQCKLCPS